MALLQGHRYCIPTCLRWLAESRLISRRQTREHCPRTGQEPEEQQNLVVVVGDVEDRVNEITSERGDQAHRQRAVKTIRGTAESAAQRAEEAGQDQQKSGQTENPALGRNVEKQVVGMANIS